MYYMTSGLAAKTVLSHVSPRIGLPPPNKVHYVGVIAKQEQFFLSFKPSSHAIEQGANVQTNVARAVNRSESSIGLNPL